MKNTKSYTERWLGYTGYTLVILYLYILQGCTGYQNGPEIRPAGYQAQPYKIYKYNITKVYPVYPNHRSVYVFVCFILKILLKSLFLYDFLHNMNIKYLYLKVQTTHSTNIFYLTYLPLNITRILKNGVGSLQ